MEELFDIVGDGDEVIGRATRKEAHTLGHIHRSVLFFIFDREGRETAGGGAGSWSGCRRRAQIIIVKTDKCIII